MLRFAFSWQSLVLKNLLSTRSEAHLESLLRPIFTGCEKQSEIGSFLSDTWSFSSEAGAISVAKDLGPSIHSVFCSSFIENHRHSIVNGYDQPIGSGSDDGEGSLPWPVPADTTRKVRVTRAISLGSKIEHEILNCRDLSRRVRRGVGWHTSCGLRARRSLYPLNK
jgi:hypothetical protein